MVKAKIKPLTKKQLRRDAQLETREISMVHSARCTHRPCDIAAGSKNDYGVFRKMNYNWKHLIGRVCGCGNYLNRDDVISAMMKHDPCTTTNGGKCKFVVKKHTRAHTGICQFCWTSYLKWVYYRFVFFYIPLSKFPFYFVSSIFIHLYIHNHWKLMI